MNKLKNIEIDMFKVVIKICNKLNLRYFVLGGTCLGAVRHKGFIPWDDDIDIGMPRNDYEKFLKEAPKFLPKNLFLQWYGSDDNYPMNFAKLRNSNTTFREFSIKHFDINHGVYLDIFPLDGYNKSFISKFMDRLFQYRVSLEYDILNHNQKILHNIKKLLIKFLFKDYRTARNYRDKLIKAKPYDSTEYVHNYCGAWGNKEIVPRSVFGEGKKGVFNGIEVTLPVDTDTYLKGLYGEYMKFPPIEARKPHHYCEVIDLDRSYIYYKNHL